MRQPKYDVAVKINMKPAIARGETFFKVYDKCLEVRFREVLMYTVKAAQSFAPVGRANFVIDWKAKDIRKVSGGTLRRSIKVVLYEALEEVLRGKVGVPTDSPAAKYARMRELGGTITPVRARSLLFSPDGVHIVHAQVVHQDAHPYLVPALVLAWPLLKKVPELAFRDAARMTGSPMR